MIIEIKEPIFLGIQDINESITQLNGKFQG
jgi:hypothetical protein